LMERLLAISTADRLNGFLYRDPFKTISDNKREMVGSEPI